MGQRYSKADVTFHSDGVGRRANPAINVKVRNWGYHDVDLMRDEPALDLEQCDAIIQSVYERHAVRFWDNAKLQVEILFGRGYTVYQEGRSGGWMVVHGLPDVEEWDAVMLGKWRSLESWAERYIKTLCSEGEIKTTIRVGRLVQLASGVDDMVEVQ